MTAGATTFDRMSAAAAAEAGRIETVQAELVQVGILTQPDNGQLALRDDFDGIVRLIELIKNDKLILERLTRK